MNMNEVLANRGNQLAAERGVALERPLHPNDSVNMSQSSNDTFPTAMHVAAAVAVTGRLLPAIDRLTATLRRLEEVNAGVVKSGRTHLQDAVPISFSQEISGWRGLLEARARSSWPRCRVSIAWRSAARRWARGSTRRPALTRPSPRRWPSSRACPS